MKKKSLVADNRERAFRAYLSTGGNMREARLELERGGLTVSDDSLRAWAKKYNFEARLEKADAVLRASVLSRKDIRMSLMHQARQYETYLSGVLEPDPQVTYALMSIYKLLDKFLPAEVPEVSGVEWSRRARIALYEAYGIGDPKKVYADAAPEGPDVVEEPAP